MPSYPYKCACGHREDVVKPIRDCEAMEICRKCHQVMEVDYSDKGWAKQGALVFQGHYNAALGQYVGSQRDVIEAQNKIEDATGSRPIEIGNEKPKAQPVKHDVDMREVLDYAASLQVERGETPNAG